VTPQDVSAVIVTRGDIDLSPVLDSLPYPDVVVWNNSARNREDLKTYGRYAALPECANDVVFFQDDDIVLLDHDALLSAYEPGVIVANMSDGWWQNRDLHDSVFVGAGAILDRSIPRRAFEKYDSMFPRDEVFFLYPEAMVTIPSRIKRVDLPLEVLPWGYAPNRMNAQPWFEEWMAESIRRGRAVRDKFGGKE